MSPKFPTGARALNLKSLQTQAPGKEHRGPSTAQTIGQCFIRPWLMNRTAKNQQNMLGLVISLLAEGLENNARFSCLYCSPSCCTYHHYHHHADDHDDYCQLLVRRCCYRQDEDVKDDDREHNFSVVFLHPPHPVPVTTSNAATTVTKTRTRQGQS